VILIIAKLLDYHAEFECSYGMSVRVDICWKSTLRVPLFTVTEGHQNSHGSIGTYDCY